MKTVWTGLVGVLALSLALGQASAQETPKKEGAKKEGAKKSGDRPRGGQPGGPGGRQFTPPTNPLFDSLDADKDGEISAEELSSAVAALKKLDKDGDGKLSREETRPVGGFGGGGFGRGGGPGGFNTAALVERIMGNDKNKDGKVTKDEMPENQQAFFDRLDENKDGALDKAEVEKGLANFGRRGGRSGQPGERGGDRPARPKRPGTESAEKQPSEKQ
jgi:Ca2+-binding EF-hand superfamily protein